ncbi:hypothetical protein [Telmatospirillum sp.]|uniref:hypothetical protein n=1 Tax=Telmatospirillum sp. TaxID=2079197 RepID=UPI002840C186|nr:hypothetical protein [Telmatospirillum sp.]MDR3436351.1 hypothetical protein [Telmatospirillum sp.]
MAFSACEANLSAAKRIAQILPPLPHGGRSDGQGFQGTGEPALNEMLQDPTLGCLLASDGVQQDHLLALIQTVRTRLAL